MIRIYVAALGAYNHGALHGKWIDCTDPAEVKEEIQEMLKRSPIPNDEEWAIHDYEADGLEGIGGYSIEDICALSDAVEEHSNPFVAYFNGMHYSYDDVDDLISNYEHEYRGTYGSMREFAEEMAEERIAGMIAGVKTVEWVERYFDYDAYARDLEMDFDIFEYKGETHVFYKA